MTITIDVFQDTVCPWCRIGKRNLALALERWSGALVQVTYHAYFLQPDLPDEGADFAAVMNAKSGGRKPLETWFDAPRRMGAASGLLFNFEKIRRSPNTMLSHQLIALAPEAQRPAIIDSLYTAYFEQGKDIGSLDVLLGLAAEAGMDRAETRRLLESGAARAQVLDDVDQAHQMGITGVPFFIFNDRYALSGAQPPDALIEILNAIQDGSIESKIG
jgi:predicted DsbA family dithiol-disulfide isomerase